MRDPVHCGSLTIHIKGEPVNMSVKRPWQSNSRFLFCAVVLLAMASNSQAPALPAPDDHVVLILNDTVTGGTSRGFTNAISS